VGEVAFVAGIAATLWLVGHLGLRPVGQALSNVGVTGILLLALAHMPTLAILGLCWWLLAGEARGVRAAKFVWGRLARDASSVLLPFSTVAGYMLGVRAVVLTGVSGMQAAVSGLVDIIVEQAAKAPYMVASIACLLWLAPGAKLAAPLLGVLTATVGLTIAVGFRWDSVRARLVKVVVRVNQLWPGAPDPEQPSAEATLVAALAQRRRLGIGFGLQLAGWFLGAGEAWLALRLLGAHIHYGEAVAIDGVYAAVRAFAFAVPAAIGVQEGSYVTLCGIFGVDAPTALAFSLLCRARDVVISAPAVLVWQILERERRRSRAYKRGEVRHARVSSGASAANNTPTRS
jgi:putative membrane protein